MSNRIELAQSGYQAYARDDRAVLEDLLAEDFVFYSPVDDCNDRQAYFERCWPNHETTEAFEFTRSVESGDDVIVTYEATKTDGKRFRNTEVLTFEGDRIVKQEVYWGWDV